MSHTRPPVLSAIAIVAAGAAALLLPGVPGAIAGAAVVWLLPGAAFALMADPRATRLDVSLAALALSPVFVAVIGAAVLLAGGSAGLAGAVLILASVTAGAAVALRARPTADAVPRGPLLTIVAAAALLCLLTGLLPQVSEWWRVRSDAWFHAAVISEIRAFGVPPTDPYFSGMPLQYMWLYHVLVDVEAAVTGLDVFRTMALVNVRALAGLILAVFLLARALGGRWDRAAGSALMLPLGLNAMFWFFLPVKLARAFFGEVRGFEEVARQLRIEPFDYPGATRFMGIYNNPEFYLDKYMVMTAFSLGLTLMAVCWLGAMRFVSREERYGLALLFIGTAGAVAFHSLVAFVTLASFGGALAIGWMRRDRALYRPALVVVLTSAAACAVMSPYLYSVMHVKESEHLIPVSVTFGKTVAMFLSATSAFVLLYPFQRDFLARRDATATFFMAATVALVGFCLILRLPQSNAYDKPGYFVWFPFAVVAGWTLADLWARRSRSRRDRALAMAVAFLMLVPVNAIAVASCYLMKPPEAVTAGDRALGAWVRAATSRDAVFIDDDNQVALLVLGPRRYYFGRKAYAVHWGYDKAEMATRFHVRRGVLGGGLDAVTLEALADFPAPLYVIDRGQAVCRRYPTLFDAVHREGDTTVWRVRPDDCRAAAAQAPAGPVDTDALIDEAGL